MKTTSGSFKCPFKNLPTDDCSRTGCHLSDGADRLGASLSEHQSLVAVQVLGSLDEAEVDRGFVPCP